MTIPSDTTSDSAPSAGGVTTTAIGSEYRLYLVSNILSTAAVALATLFLAYTLTPADYGALSGYLVVLSFISMFVGLSVHGAVGASFFRLGFAAFAEYVSSAIVVLVGSFCVVGLLLFAFADSAIAAAQTSGTWLVLACLESFFRFLRLILLSVLMSMRAARRYSAYQLGYSTLDVVLVIVFVTLYHDVESRLYAQLVASASFFLLTLASLHQLGLLTVRLRVTHLLHILKYGVFLFPAVLGAFMMTMADKHLVNVNVGREAVGVYMFCYQISAAATLFWESFNKVYAPRLFQFLSRGEGEGDLRQITRSYVTSVVVLTAVGAVAAYIVAPYVVPAGFEEAQRIMPILILGEGLNGLYLVYNNHFHYFNKTYVLSVVTLVSGLTGLLLLSTYLARFGVLFAAFTYVLVCLIRLVSVRLLLNSAGRQPMAA